MGIIRLTGDFTALMLIILVVMTFNSRYCEAQVTFSRDWNPGKRAGGGTPVADCGDVAKSAANVCHMLLDELRQLVACESRTMMRVLQVKDQETNPLPIFFTKR